MFGNNSGAVQTETVESEGTASTIRWSDGRGKGCALHRGTVAVVDLAGGICIHDSDGGSLEIYRSTGSELDGHR